MFDVTHQYELKISINNKPVFEYPHSDSYTYIEGRVGSKYEIELHNHSHERVLMVPSVDGLSVLNGNQDWDDGYVVDPHTYIRVPGWRRDSTKAAAFEFADAKESYTNRMGNGRSNVGVIGLMVFRQKLNYILGSSIVGGTLTNGPTDILRGIHSSPIFASAQNSVSLDTSVNNLGTGWGEDTAFNTTSTAFEKRDPNYPDAILALYYDSAKGLERRGIITRGSSSNPDPFPGYSNSGPYVKAPPPLRRR